MTLLVPPEEERYGAPMLWKTEQHPVEYPAAVSFMETRVAAIREAGAEDMVWLLEHPPLYTAGTSARGEDLLAASFPVYESGRGGQYTYHGPGQRVAYVMMDLKPRDLRRYICNLEEWVIQTLACFDIKGERRAGRVGVWVVDGGREEKIAAVGVRVRKWVAYHGISINLAPDLAHYRGIVPCGIAEHGVTSFERLGIKASLSDLDEALKRTWLKVMV